MATRKQQTVNVIVRTDAVHVAGKHYTYGQALTMPADKAKPLLEAGMVEQV